MKQLNFIQKKFYSLTSRLGVIRRDLMFKDVNDFPKCFKTWALGFRSEKYRLYNFNKNNSKDYLPDRCATLTRFINCPYDIVLNNKMIFEEMVSQYIKIPRNYALIDNGAIVPLESKYKISNINSVIELCNKKGGLVIKPIEGFQGKGVLILKSKNDELFAKNKKVSKRELEGYISKLDNHIITEFIEQGEYSSKLYLDSTNTMRILAMMDPETHEPFIARAVQRIGSKNSGGLDNFTLGGYSANIDIETGMLSAAATKIGSQDLTWHEVHPDSGAQIKGVKVPRWNEIKEKVLSTMRELPYLKYVGWDIVLTDEDIVTIEGNNHSQVGVIQLHKPLLVEPRIKRFYEYYDII